MNYYEQFYDDLETMDYDEANARHEHDERRRHPDYIDLDDPNFERDYNHGPYRDDRDPFYEQSHRGHPDNSGRGPDQFHGSRGQGEFEGHRGQGHFQGSRGQRGNYFERGRGRGARNDRGQAGQWRGRGGAERGQSAPYRGGGAPRGGKRGKFGMNFVKAGTAFMEENQEGNTGGNTEQSSASNASSGTISGIEKEVEQGLKEFRCQLGYGYGYGARDDLVNGTPEAAWIAMGDAPIGSMQTEPMGTMSEGYSSEMPGAAVGSNEEAPVEVDTMSCTEVTSVQEKPKIAAPVKTGVVRPSWNFVKAQSEFRSTDVAFHETASEMKPVPNTVAVNMGNKRVGLGFGVSAKAVAGGARKSVVQEKFQGGLKDGRNITFDAKFARLHEAVKQKNLPNKNGIEVMHMAIDRVKMTMVDDIRPGGRTSTGQPMFLCRLEVDGVLVGEGLSTTKKGAKHDTFKNAVELLLKEGLTVKEAPGGGLELKEREPEPGAGPFHDPPVSAAASKWVTKPGLGPSDAQAQLPAKQSQTGNMTGQKNSSQGVSTAGKSATAYVKPKIVFHNPQMDRPLTFKMPGKTGPSPGGQSSHSAEMMAQNLLDFVKNESAEVNKVTKDTIEVKNQTESERKTDVQCITGSESTRNEKLESFVVTTSTASSLSSVATTAENYTSQTDDTCTSLESSPSNVPETGVNNKSEAIDASTTVGSSMDKPDVNVKSKNDATFKNVQSSLSLVASSTSVSSASNVPGPARATSSTTIPRPPYIPRQTFVKQLDSQRQNNLTMTDSVKNKPQTDTKGFSDIKSPNVPTQFIKQAFVKSSESFDEEKSQSSSSEITQTAPPQSLGVYRPPSKSGRLQSIVHAVNQSPQNNYNPRKRVNNTLLTPVHSKLKSRKVNKMNDLDDLSQFIIIDSTEVSGCQTMTDLSILHNSANLNKVVMKVEYEPTGNGFNCSFVISDHLIGTMFGVNKEEAKVNAAKATLDELREMCYTIKVRQNVDSDEGGLTKEELMSDIQKSNERLPDSNVGNMMLRKMGWTGEGGVGKLGQGRAEPVKAEMVIGREGLGLKAARGIGREFNKTVTKMLEDYVRSDEQKDLHFSSELSKEERAVIHNVGQKMGLKTQSKGKDSDRYLIISRKRSARELLEHVMRNGGSTSKYLVVPPGSGDNEFWSAEDVAFGQGKQ